MIHIDGLTYAYAGTEKPAVRNLSFEIERGEIFGFLGPSGAGKSTTQKILNGLLQGYQGQVIVMGKELNQWKSDYFERIGVSFEFPNHYQKLTAVENLTYYSALYSGTIRSPQDLLTMVGLEADGNTLVSQYSKGMKNRLSVARSLLHNPELIFMDEPTAGLDPMNARRVKNIIKEQKENGRTVFLTTHDMNVANELCDRVAFIVDGEINLIDSPRNLRLRHSEPKVRIEYQQNGHLERVDFSLLGIGKNPNFLTLLDSDGVETIHTQEATLEDIFIEVTGRSLA
ncbi:MAG: ABC transporter ATP-binding protein [Chloroflexi bacterium]|nr:ABC transporter ATP-binding protein [Chloroflexota bacterium]